MKAGFIGLGHMGNGMSKNVLKANGQLLVSDLSDDAKALLKAEGADVAENNAQVAKECDVIFLSLPMPTHVRSVVAGPDGLIENGHEGQYIIDLSTVDSDTSKDMAAEAAKKGIKFIDFPVSGGVPGAQAGTLAIMAGCKEEDVADIRNLIDAIGKTVFIGSIGGGSTMKLINNFMAFTHLVADAEGVLMADQLGIDINTFFDVVLNASGYDKPLALKKNKIIENEYSPNFAIDLVVKDLNLAAEVCKNNNIPNYSLNQAIQMYRMAQNRGLGQMDTIAIVGMLREIMPVK